MMKLLTRLSLRGWWSYRVMIIYHTCCSVHSHYHRKGTGAPKVWYWCQVLKPRPVSTRSPLTKFEKLYKAQQHKGASVDALTGLVPCKISNGLQREFQYSAQIERHEFVSICCKQRYMNRHISQSWTNFWHSGMSFLLVKLNIKARQDVPEILTANL